MLMKFKEIWWEILQTCENGITVVKYILEKKNYKSVLNIFFNIFTTQNQSIINP